LFTGQEDRMHEMTITIEVVALTLGVFVLVFYIALFKDRE